MRLVGWVLDEGGGAGSGQRARFAGPWLRRRRPGMQRQEKMKTKTALGIRTTAALGRRCPMRPGRLLVRWRNGRMEGLLGTWKSFVGCFGTMKEFGDFQKPANEMGFSSPSGPSPRATDRDPEPVCAPPTSSQPAADCCLRQPSGPAVWAARTHRPSQAGARHMKSRTGLAIWFALHPIKRVFPVSACRCLGFSTARRADGKLDNTHISKIGKSVGLDLGYGDSTLCIHGLFRRLISFRLGTLATMPSRGPAATGAPPPPDPALPSIYTDFRALLDEKVSPGRFVNVIGVVKDCRLPVPTGGTGELKLPIPILTH